MPVINTNLFISPDSWLNKIYQISVYKNNIKLEKILSIDVKNKIAHIFDGLNPLGEITSKKETFDKIIFEKLF